MDTPSGGIASLSSGIGQLGPHLFLTAMRHIPACGIVADSCKDRWDYERAKLAQKACDLPHNLGSARPWPLRQHAQLDLLPDGLGPLPSPSARRRARPADSARPHRKTARPLPRSHRRDLRLANRQAAKSPTTMPPVVAASRSISRAPRSHSRKLPTTPPRAASSTAPSVTGAPSTTSRSFPPLSSSPRCSTRFRRRGLPQVRYYGWDSNKSLGLRQRTVDTVSGKTHASRVCPAAAAPTGAN
jgi:hypothetical protein